MIKIASVVWYKVLPAKFGGQKGTALFNKYLAEEFPLVCLCSSDNQPAEELPYKVIPSLPVGKFQFINPFIWIKIIRIAKKEKVTHVILEHPYHAIAGWVVKIFLGTRLIVHSHNIEYLRFRALGKWWWPLLYVTEKFVHRRADLNLFKTKNDLSVAVKKFRLQSHRCTIVPFGVETFPAQNGFRAAEVIRQRHGIPAGNAIILFAATLDYQPNAEAVSNIFHEIAPRLDKISGIAYTIIICGRLHFKEFNYLLKCRHPNVLLAGEVDRIEEYFQAASVFINPVDASTGIQTKSVEAINHQVPLVCFPAGIAGIEGVSASVAEKNNWHQFSELIVKAMSEKRIPVPVFGDGSHWRVIIEKLKPYFSSISNNLR